MEQPIRAGSGWPSKSALFGHAVWSSGRRQLSDRLLGYRSRSGLRLDQRARQRILPAGSRESAYLSQRSRCDRHLYWADGYAWDRALTYVKAGGAWSKGEHSATANTDLRPLLNVLGGQVLESV